MARFLSPEWIAALDRAAREAAPPTGARLTVQQVVRTEDGEVRYHLSIDDGSLRVGAGQAEAPDVTLTQDYAVAAAISRGELNAERALAAGQLKLAGDLQLLLHHARTLATLEDAFGAVRAETTY